MRKSKRYQKKKSRRSRRRNKTTKRMKGGGVLGFSDIGDAFKSIGSGLTAMTNTVLVNPEPVPPNVKGGDNPLPYIQPGPAVDINNSTYHVGRTQSIQSR